MGMGDRNGQSLRAWRHGDRRQWLLVTMWPSALVVSVRVKSDVTPQIAVEGQNAFPFVTFADDLPKTGDEEPRTLGLHVTMPREHPLSPSSGNSALLARESKAKVGGPTFNMNGRVIGVN